MFEMFGLNFDPFESSHGGERDATGNLTQRGKEDFFAPMFDFSESIDSWKRFLDGDISWRDFVDPGSVINNPAQKIADPGEFFTGNKLTRDEFGKRGRASAAIAALIYGGIGAPGLLSGGGEGLASGAGSAGEGGASQLIGANVGDTGMLASSAGNAGVGGASQLVSNQSWWSKLLNQNNIGMMQQILGGGSGQQSQEQSVSSSPNNYAMMQSILDKIRMNSVRTPSELAKIDTINPFR